MKSALTKSSSTYYESDGHCYKADRLSRSKAVVNALLKRYHGTDCIAESPKLIDGLFASDGDVSRWLTGIIELSVSFRNSQRLTIRALSEVLLRRPLNPALTKTGLNWGTDIFRLVSESGSSSFATPLFHKLYERFYMGKVAKPAPLFRFGIGLELNCLSPVLKVYFDLHATCIEHRRRTFEWVAEILGETSSLEAWKQTCPDINFDSIRVIGADFGANNSIRTKFYWGARHLTWEAIVAASRIISGDQHVETLNRLRREIAIDPASLTSHMVSMCSVNGERSMKIDVYVARLYENDKDAYDAIERFRLPTIDAQGSAPFDIISDLEPHETKCIQQYIGLELPPNRSSRVTIYYRPIGFDTEYLNPAMRPRLCD